jgi:hypothetical protein
MGLTLDVLVPFVSGKAYAVGTDTVILISAIVFLRILRAGGPTVVLGFGRVLFGDVLTMVRLQWAAIAGIPNEVGSPWRCFAVAGAGVAILTTTHWLLPDPSWTNRGIIAASCALPAAILGWGVLWRWRLRELT